MTQFHPCKHWTRREWLAANLATVGAAPAVRGAPRHHRHADAVVARHAAHATLLDPGPLRQLAQRAVDAAKATGAAYADARLTRTVEHHYDMFSTPGYDFHASREERGVGIRVLVNGYWGFAACSVWNTDGVVHLARDAVAQAKANALGMSRTTELGQYPAASGSWVTPIAIDPFAVTIEEKVDYMNFWRQRAHQYKLVPEPPPSWMHFARQERVVATSEGALFDQTIYQSQGRLVVSGFEVQRLDPAGRGWELFLDANISGQIAAAPEMLAARKAIAATPSTIGQYTLVCDGSTMAALVNATLGVATQLDRALGYEANAGGTSYLSDPLAMVGQEAVASPLVTLTADRAMPQGLATVKWDDEGVEPDTCTLVKAGVLTDFQTTRESAGWLAEYYAKAGRPVHSHGHAASEHALTVTMQHTPNLVLEPNTKPVSLDDLISEAQDGILITNGAVVQADRQARNGLLSGDMRLIKKGRLGARLANAGVLFGTANLWKRVIGLGGAVTIGRACVTQFSQPALMGMRGVHLLWPEQIQYGKGQPPQASSRTVTAPAAIIRSQAVIDPWRRA